MNIRIIILVFLTLAPFARGQSTINPANRHAFGANTGWIDWHADGINGAVIGEYVCSGYLYAANFGWVSLGSGHPLDGIYYQNNSATDFGINQDGLGNLRGYAYSANVGWINFENTGAPKVDLRTGRFSGLVYGANIGWINLSNTVAFLQTDTILPGADVDGDGIADAYEFLWVPNLFLMSATGDLDGDGFTDLQEYLAGTNPLDPNDNLRIASFSFGTGGTNTVVTWTTHPTRLYRVQERLDLSTGSSWLDSGLDLISPDAGSTTTRSFFNAPSSQRFLRIEAVRPLSP
jgi:hypothetical protein